MINNNSSDIQGSITTKAARALLTSNLEKNNIGINNQSHDQPFLNDQNSNNTLVMINSNWHEEYHVIIEESKHENDDYNNLLVSIDEEDNKVNINRPIVSNAATSITTNDGENSDINNNVMIVLYLNQNINHPQSKGIILVTNNDDLHMNDNDNGMDPPLDNNTFDSNNADIMINQNNRAA